MNIKKIYSKRIMSELIKRGHSIIWTEENKKFKWLRVFVFEDTDEFKRDYLNINNIQ